MSLSDGDFLHKAFLQARRAQARGEVPVGAVLVRDGQIVAGAYNLKEYKQDATAHAELLVLKKAMRLLKTWHLEELTLYSTLEPCPMCAGAILHARIKRVVFGALDYKWGGAGSIVDLFTPQKFNHVLEVAYTPSVECSAILTSFFRDLRLKSKVHNNG